MHWQTATLASLAARLPLGSTARPYGSYPHGLDRWSDLDLAVELTAPAALDALVDSAPWAWQDSAADGTQTVRVVLCDGRRLDLAVTGERMTLPPPPDDLGIRFDAALAAVRLGRGDALIGTHLALGIAREALVLGMRLRDRDEGHDHHRGGTARDGIARRIRDAVAEIAPGPGPADAAPRPTPLERLAALRSALLVELEPDHRPDWSGLVALIDRGSGIR